MIKTENGATEVKERTPDELFSDMLNIITTFITYSLNLGVPEETIEKIAVKNMPIDKLQKICAIIGNEQEPILDKIREEIKVMISSRGFLSYSVRYINKEIDKVFDKYKAESEG